MSLPDAVSGVQTEHIRYLDTLYKKALDECPGLISNSFALMGTKLVKGQGFDMNYRGES